MKKTLLILIISLLGTSITIAQKKVAITSFYLDREVDFSLMQAFNDDSERKIKELMKDPEFNIRPVILNFHDFAVNDIMAKAPFDLIDEATVLNSSTYAGFQNLVDEEKSEQFEPYTDYLKLGNKFNEEFLTLATEQGADGIMLIELQFFVRKNGLKTVIMAQTKFSLYNQDGKRAWTYLDFGWSKEGINTFAGFVVSRQDEVMPLFTQAVDHLKEKMSNNFEKRAIKSIKKL